MKNEPVLFAFIGRVTKLEYQVVASLRGGKLIPNALTRLREVVLDKVLNDIIESSEDMFSYITLEKSFDDIFKMSPSVDVNDRPTSLDTRHLQIDTEIICLIGL